MGCMSTFKTRDGWGESGGSNISMLLLSASTSEGDEINLYSPRKITYLTLSRRCQQANWADISRCMYCRGKGAEATLSLVFKGGSLTVRLDTIEPYSHLDKHSSVVDVPLDRDDEQNQQHNPSPKLLPRRNRGNRSFDLFVAEIQLFSDLKVAFQTVEQIDGK